MKSTFPFVIFFVQVKIWQIPQQGLTGNLSDWLVDLHGHHRRIGYLEWHPTADNILLSAGFDYKVCLLNTLIIRAGLEDYKVCLLNILIQLEQV